MASSNVAGRQASCKSAPQTEPGLGDAPSRQATLFVSDSASTAPSTDRGIGPSSDGHSDPNAGKDRSWGRTTVRILGPNSPVIDPLRACPTQLSEPPLPSCPPAPSCERFAANHEGTHAQVHRSMAPHAAAPVQHAETMPTAAVGTLTLPGFCAPAKPTDRAHQNEEMRHDPAVWQPAPKSSPPSEQLPPLPPMIPPQHGAGSTPSGHPFPDAGAWQTQQVRRFYSADSVSPARAQAPAFSQRPSEALSLGLPGLISVPPPTTQSLPPTRPGRPMLVGMVAALGTALFLAAGAAALLWHRATLSASRAEAERQSEVSTAGIGAPAADPLKSSRASDPRVSAGSTPGRPARLDSDVRASGIDSAAASTETQTPSVLLNCTPACSTLGSVICDGHPMKIAQGGLALPLGKHQCRFAAAGYAPSTVEIEIGEGGDTARKAIVLSPVARRHPRAKPCGTFINRCPDEPSR